MVERYVTLIRFPTRLQNLWALERAFYLAEPHACGTLNNLKTSRGEPMFFKRPIVRIMTLALGWALGSTCLGTATANPTVWSDCPDNHVPGCFFDKQTLTSASGEFSYARHSGLFLTGALAQDQLAVLQEQGVVAVIDIRQADEDRSALESAASALGMVYQNTPLFEKGTRTISLDAVNAITAFHKTYKKTPHVVACSSGNRSSAWFGAHQHLDHGLDADASVAAAREAFLRDDMASELRRFIVLK
jgi:protein tyrosine phosphatase (PTP) superfamily phosphohydrolase (DUF442 family)